VGDECIGRGLKEPKEKVGLYPPIMFQPYSNVLSRGWKKSGGARNRSSSLKKKQR